MSMSKCFKCDHFLSLILYSFRYVDILHMLNLLNYVKKHLTSYTYCYRAACSDKDNFGDQSLRGQFVRRKKFV